MEQVKRVEIIANALELAKITDGLNKAGVAGYTVVRNVTGKSPRGGAYDDLEMSVLANAYIIAICPPEQISRIAEVLQPILKKYGGVCLVSDAEWIFH